MYRYPGERAVTGEYRGETYHSGGKIIGFRSQRGTSVINHVTDYAEKLLRKGLVIIDGPAHDVVSNTGMIAAGAQVIAFTTGQEPPLDSPIAPVIKISSNSTVYHLMKDNIDINARAILDGDESRV